MTWNFLSEYSLKKSTMRCIVTLQFMILKADLYFFSSISQIGVQGEHLGLYKEDGLSNVTWVSTSEPPKNQPLTWYKVNTYLITCLILCLKTKLLLYLGNREEWITLNVVGYCGPSARWWTYRTGYDSHGKRSGLVEWRRNWKILA